LTRWRQAEAADAYREALALGGTDAERRYLTRRLAEASAVTQERPLRRIGRYGRMFQAEMTGCSCS
jgi:hypothetical protein